MAPRNVTHCIVHLRQHPLFLSFRDATKPHGISRHAHCETLPETALLASVSVNPHNGAGLILQTFLVLDVLLDAAPEETLAALTGVNSIMKSRGDVPTDFT